MKKKLDKDSNVDGEPLKPKVFISYSWTSPEHQDAIRAYSERLMGDGVDVIFDLWDLKKGQDKYVFMEKMVGDPSVSHVLIFSDSEYARKADSREAGVGTESQILSPKLYEDVGQTRVLPIVCEYTADGKPCLPVFVKSRIHVNFSSPEAVNENWEGLIRHLFGKPLHQKPKVGTPPSYLNESKPIFTTLSKWSGFRDALLNSKPSAAFLRTDFIDSVISQIRELQPREGAGDAAEVEERVLTDLKNLLPLRDQVVDWLLVEERMGQEGALSSLMLDFLERLLATKYHPDDMQSWSDWWFEATGAFVLELFLYIVASLVKSGRATVLRDVLSGSYLRPEAYIGNQSFTGFSDFYTYAPVLDGRNRRLSLNRISLLADVLKERATRSDLPFRDIMQADLLLHFYSMLNPVEWYPQTLVYAGYGTRFSLFMRAEQHRHFDFLKTVMQVDSADQLRSRFNESYENRGAHGPRVTGSLRELLAVNKWDTRT